MCIYIYISAGRYTGSLALEITCIHIYTQLKHVWVCMRAASLYVCASVYRCICMEVYMYVQVFIGVYAWKFICMCECL